MYISTRGGVKPVTAAEAIKQGLAGDGGLFVPENVPTVSDGELAEWVSLDYQARAVRILEKFLSDYTETEISQAVREAYGHDKFNTRQIAPVVPVDEKNFVLELWHGPTSAFKDMALQLLPQLLSQALKKTGETDEIVILVATSGDTGKAALEGFRDVPQTKIFVFFPEQGVSDIQRLQMVTQEGGNVGVMAVKGNFDDAQNGVKRIFSDRAMEDELAAKGFKLSSANSINWGRLVPQVVYYFSAYLDLVEKRRISVGQPVNFAVPTGNFGNILAGYYAKLMGLPVRKLICASNSNNVLTQFITTGEYDRRRPFHKTISPSMDILISSNLERLLYLLASADKVQLWMQQLAAQGHYQVDGSTLERLRETFVAAWADDSVTTGMIGEVYRRYNYLADTHTAVAWHAARQYREDSQDGAPLVIVSTASPFKFADSVLEAVEPGAQLPADEFQELLLLSERTGWAIPDNLLQLKNKTVLHQKVCDREEMGHAVREFLQRR